MSDGLPDEIDSLLKITTGMRGFEAMLNEMRGAIDHLAVCKATHSEVDIVANTGSLTAERLDVVARRITSLAQQVQQVMHTSFAVDPETVIPLLQPLSDRLQVLEYDLALRRDDRMRALGAQKADDASYLEKLRARIDGDLP